MPMPIEFTLTDADGNTHKYTLLTHRATEGTALVLKLVDVGGDGLGRIVEAVLTSEELLAALMSKGVEVDLKALAEQFDIRGIVRDVRRALADIDGADLLRELVRHCSRDGKPLHVDANFDEAFRANYGELFALAWRSVQENKFLGFIGALVGS